MVLTQGNSRIEFDQSFIGRAVGILAVLLILFFSSCESVPDQYAERPYDAEIDNRELTVPGDPYGHWKPDDKVVFSMSQVECDG